MRSALVILLAGASFSAAGQRFQATINSFLQKEKTQWQLTDTDISNWTISDQYDNAEAGITYTYLNQQVDGIRVFNAVSSMVIRNGKVVYYANRFYPDAAKKANAVSPALSSEEAIQAMAAYLGLSMTETPALLEKESNRLRYTYTRAGISKEDIQVELVLVPGPEMLQLAWNVVIAPNGTSDWWNIRIDAMNGSFMEKNNWTTYCDFSTEDHRESDCEAIHVLAESLMPTTESMSGSGTYNIYPIPLEAPSFGGRTIVTDQQNPVASPYGWHDTNGVEGAEYTITRGNNVYVYDDPQALNEPGYSPDGGIELNFDFPIDFYRPTLQNKDAALTNLFYMNNMLHDVLYAHGFDEAAGNFQANNYTAEGFGGDYVMAEGQDGGGTNNANFATPIDGSNGRMQMFMWDLEAVGSMKVVAPDTIAGYYAAVPATFGPSLTLPVTGYTAILIDAVDPTSNACDSILNPQDLSGKIAIIDRGECPYIEKISAAEAAGAIGVIVVNTTSGTPIVMGGSAGATIPAVMIYKADGDMIRALLNAGDSVQVTLALGPSDIDGALDNGIIAHEYGHGLSNRLTGGPSMSDCLDNAEQGGEGWSDWLALIMTIEPGDVGTDPEGIGSYAKNDASGKGLRRYYYSTDMSINPQTYGDVAGSAGPHAIGEIWSQTLWDMTWKLIDTEGFDADWYNGTAGNNIAMRLVIEGMKMQPCRPGYVDARNAILAADEVLYGGAYKCLIWEAFAGRGLGAHATQGSSKKSNDQAEDFAIPNTCLIATMPPAALFAVDKTVNCFGHFSFTDLSTDIPQYYRWDFGDGNTSEVEDPIHSYDVPGEYTVSLIVTNNIGADTFQMDVVYGNPDAPAVNGNKVVCEGSYTSLSADVLPGNTAFWSAGDSVVYTGTVFKTAPLSVSETYSVIQSKYAPVYNVGPATNSFFGGGNHNTGFEGKLLFETFAPLRLISVLVYASGEGDRTISLYDENDQLVEAVTVFLTDGENRVTLDMDIADPGKYSLANISENLYRNNGGATYPYRIDNLLSIYSSNATGDELAYYYYFYDWEVQETTCVSDPVEVTVVVEPGPFAGFIAEAFDLTANFTDISSGDPIGWTWDFGDGSPIVNEQNPVHAYAMEGLYEVELTVTNGSCVSTYRQQIEIGGTTGTKDIREAFGLKLYPNPATNEVTLDFDEAYAGKLQLNVTNSTGRLVISRLLDNHAGRQVINTSALTVGTYQFQLIGEDGVTVRRVSVVR